MQIQNHIIAKLEAAFEPDYLEVVNESHMHSVPENSETHFKVTLVTNQFVGQRMVGRHQSVYKVLVDELNGPVHALALHTHSLVEWQNKGKFVPDSPNCLGGSKKGSSNKN